MNIGELIQPFRFRTIRKYFSGQAPAILDVGCANDAPKLTRKFFPNCSYDAIDIAAPSTEMLSHIDNFFLMDLERLDFSALGAATYDIIILAHVIEHVRNGLDVVAALARRLKPGGIIYVEYPRAKSIGFPSAVNTLQFCDDPTHVRLYALPDIANVILDAGLRVLNGGVRRDYVRLALFPLAIPLQLMTLMKTGRPHAKGLWDIYGFAEFVVGVRAG